MSTEPPKKPRANWEDDILADQKPGAMSKDAAKKLLQVNPGLRQQGVDTDFILQGGAGKLEAPKPLTKAPDVNKEASLAAAKDADHMFELAAQQYRQQKRELESEISMLQGKLNGLKGRYLVSVMETLASLDRSLLSPLTHAAMDKHKAFATELGFSVKKFMEYLSKRR